MTVVGSAVRGVAEMWLLLVLVTGYTVPVVP